MKGADRPPGSEWGEGLYRVLLWLLLPAAFRREAEVELVLGFRRLRAASRRRGVRRHLVFWPRVVIDLLWTGAAERWARRNESTGGRATMGGAIFGRGGFGQAWRRVVRAPRRALTAAMTIGFGVGAAAVVAVLGRDVLLAPVPFEEPDQLVRLREVSEDGRVWWPSRANFEDWRLDARAPVQALAAVTSPVSEPVLVGDRAVRASVVEASAGFFSIVGARFAAGRAPGRDQSIAGGEPVAAVSHDFWRGPLAGRPLDGLELRIGEERFAVVGVLEPSFGFLAEGGAWGRPEVWIPLERNPDPGSRTSHGIHVVARMSPGLDLAAADRALDALAARTRERVAEATNAHSILTTDLEDDLIGAARRPLLVLLLAAAGVVLISVMNLAGTVLVDVVGRGRELAVRRALGADRLRVFGQLLGEAALASIPGAGLGFLLALGGLDLARRLDPGALPRLDAVGLDLQVLLAAAGVAFLIAVLATLVPGLVLTGEKVSGRVAAVGRSGPGRGIRRLWQGAIVVQVAVTLVLLTGSATLVSSLVATLRSEVGYDPGGVLQAHVSLPVLGYEEADRRVSFAEEVLARLRGIPGVEAASLTDVLPHVTQARISRTGLPEGDDDRTVWSGLRFVDAEYFDVLGIPERSGDFPAPGALEVVVDATVADALLDEGAVGRAVRSSLTGEPVVVSGVVGPVWEWGVERGIIGTLYADFRLDPGRIAETHFLVRGVGGRFPDADAVRRAVSDIDPAVPVTVTSLAHEIGGALATRRLILGVTLAFGLLGLALASVGIYGIIAFVARRGRREAGVRLALGAAPHRVRAGTLWHGVRPTAIGVVVGLVASSGLVRVAGIGIDGLESLDPAGAMVSVALVLGSAVLAGYAPALRVSRVDPASALREE